MVVSNIYAKYHVHSDYSNGTTNIDSITKYKEYINKAKECGMLAFGFAEHGNVFGWLHKKEEIEKAGMKYMHCMEAYITETLEEKTRDNYHCVLIAKNYDGVLEINQLSTNSYNRKDGHFHYVPRITFDELMNTSDNVIITTACLGGILNRGNDVIKNKFIDFLKTNSYRCFLEIQHHNDKNGEQKKYNQYLYELSKEINVPLIAGTDTHCLNDEHVEGRRMLQKAKDIFFADEESWDLRFKNYDELILAYEEQDALPKEAYIAAIEETNNLANMIEEFKMDRSYKYPHLWEDSEKTFDEKIKNGIKWRGVDKYPNYQEYLDRIEEELEAYRHNGAIDFMLLMEDIIAWCLSKEIYVGYGRGSCNGSVIAWLLGITEMDSIKHKLNFQRFMNIERVSLSDIDTDFPPSRIKEVKDYIVSKTGLYCCDIITFNTIADKGAIRDIVRAMYKDGVRLLPTKYQKMHDEYIREKRINKEAEMPKELKDAINKVSGEYIKITDDVISLWESDESKARKDYDEIFSYVDLVKGVIVSVGSHPCGMVCSPHSVEDKLGTFTTATSEYPISQINMKEIDSLNYVKLDLLKLDTIELINETCKLAGIERLTPDNVDIFDTNVWNAIRDDTTQIFQWEGGTGESYIKKLLSDENIKKFQEIDPNVDRMTLLSIGNSAIRPAGASYREDLANGVVRKTGSIAIDEFLKSTFGYLVFQCQIIDFLHIYCGYTMGEADIVRRGFAKKTGTEQHIPRIKAGFIKTMTEKYGSTVEKAEEDIVAFIKVIEDASKYLFSLNHSQPYSYEGYVSGWLRTYYPLEFLTVAMNINSNNEDKTTTLTAYTKKRGINLRMPKFRYSKAGYFCNKETNSIYKGICSIKYMNTAIADELYDMADMKFDSFIELLVELGERTSLNSRQLEILIKLDFFEEFGGANYLLACNELFNKFYGKKQMKKDKAFEENIDFDLLRKYSEKETAKTFSGLNSIGLITELTKKIPNEKTGLKTKIGYQIENLGYIDIVDKKYAGYSVVVDLNVDYSPKLKLYALANGNTIPVKIDKKTFASKQLKRGDLIKVENTYRKNKMKKIDGKWVESDEKEWWVSEYKIC